MKQCQSLWEEENIVRFNKNEFIIMRFKSITFTNFEHVFLRLTKKIQLNNIKAPNFVLKETAHWEFFKRSFKFSKILVT